MTRSVGIGADGRTLLFDGCWNVRDLGPLPAAHGRQLRSGQVFRSAALDLATEADRAAIGRIGLRHVFDLRADRERTAGGRLWCAELGIQPWTRDYAGNAGELRARFIADDRPDMHSAMVRAYQRLAVEQAPALAMIFAALADGATPLLFHCAVGKDRTGTIAALLLETLGVAREDILKDYLLTNDYADAIRKTLTTHPDLALVDKQAHHIWTPLAVAHPDYLEAMFASVAAHAGSVEDFLRVAADIDAGMIARIRDRLLD